MILSVLCENTAVSDAFEAEHGLSLYIETEKHKLLFDTGRTDLFLRNARRLGIDLSEVDTLVISHGHHDHGGGLSTFLSINDKAKIYINEHAFTSLHLSDGSYVGMDQRLKAHPRLIFSGDSLKIDDELFLFTANDVPLTKPVLHWGLMEKLGDELVPDRFLHEQSLVITEGTRRVLITGCTHKGVVNLLEAARAQHVDTLIGGFHVHKQEMDGAGVAFLTDFANELSAYPVRFLTCHCTGTAQYACIKNVLGERIDYLSAGRTVIL